jgi:hypothetical protein
MAKGKQGKRHRPLRRIRGPRSDRYAKALTRLRRATIKALRHPLRIS